MILLTYHAKLRYIQRVLGLYRKESEEILAINYIQDNDAEISYILWKGLAESKIACEGYETPNREGQNVLRINNGILFILDTNERKLITLLTIDERKIGMIENLSKNLRILSSDLSRLGKKARTAREEAIKTEKVFLKYGDTIPKEAEKDIKELFEEEQKCKHEISLLQKKKQETSKELRREFKLDKLQKEFA